MANTVVDPDGTGADHLPPERLAALADEAPTTGEAAHLACCTRCADEVEVYRTLLRLTRNERDRLGEPLTDWSDLAEALAGDDLLEPRLPAQARPWPAGPSPLRTLAQAAAAVLLLSSGVVLGRLTAEHAAGSTAAAASPPGGAGSHATIAPLTELVSDTTPFSTRAQALDALARSEARYRRAVAYLMENDSSAITESRDGYRTRLAALEQVERTTRAALAAAPNDPVLNQWYISTVGAHQATIQQLVQARSNDQKHRY